MTIYNRFILNHAKLVALMAGLLLILAASQLRHFELDASADSLLLEDDEDLAFYREIQQQYPSSDEFLIVTFKPKAGDVFQDRNRQYLLALQEQLLTVDGVNNINSILNVPLLHHEKMSLTSVEQYTQTLMMPEVSIEAAQAEILQHPFYRNQLVDPKGEITALQLVLSADETLNALVQERETLRAKDNPTASELTRFDALDLEIQAANHEKVAASEARIDAVRQILSESDSSRYTTFLGGVPMIVVDMVRFVQRDLKLFGALVVCFLVLTLSIIFRQFRWVFLALTTCLSTSILLTGFLSSISFPITVISSNFISLIFIITLSIIIHLIVRFRELQANYLPGGIYQYHEMPSHQSLVSESVSQMFWPCVYTALTTIVAFLSLMVSRIRPVIDFGIMMSLGICIAFCVAFIVFPVLLKLYPSQVEKKRLNIHRTPFSLLFAKLTKGIGNWLYVVILLVLSWSIFGVSILSVENRFIDYFKSDTEIHQGMKVIDQSLGGTTPLDVIIRFPELKAQAEAAKAYEDVDCFIEDCTDIPTAEKLITEQRLGLLTDVQTILESIKGVGKVVSFASTMDVLEIANKGPLNSVEIALVDKVFPEDLRPLLIDPYVDLDAYEFRLTVRIIDSDERLVRADLMRTIERRLVEETELTAEQVRVGGMLQLYNNMLQSLFDSQIRTLGVVFIAILIMVSFLFRSIKLGLIAIMPNIFAGVFVLGVMGWAGISLDIMTITIAAICVGMAVDNSIHYIYRFKSEYEIVKDYEKAMWRSHGSIGKALYYTSTTIIVGFSILAFSSFKPTIYFGVLTSLAMLMALLGALTFLPRLLITFKPFSKS